MRFVLSIALVALGVPGAHADEALRREAAALFGQIKASADPATPAVDLGRALFWDTRASLDGATACASCHPAGDWGADRRTFSPDARGALTSRHSPTVFNSMSQPGLRWLADRKNGADQAESSLTGSMGFGSKQAGIEKLQRLGYEAAFRIVYPQEAQPLTPANYAKALAAYQGSLSTPAPFDRYLAGDESALSAQQKTGLRTFIATGCAGCHNGALLGGAALQRFGIVREYWLETGSDKVDPGRFAMTRKEEDRYVF